MIDCVHATSTGRPSVVDCGLGLHGGRPHAGLCAGCGVRKPGSYRPLTGSRATGVAHALAVRVGIGPHYRKRGADVVTVSSPAVRRLSGAGGNGRHRTDAGAATKVLLRNFQSPGDVLMLTAAVRDLHRAHPGRFLTAVQTACPGLWENNPYVVPVEQLQTPDRAIDCNYPLIQQSNQRPFHFIHGFAQDLEARLGVRIPLTDFRGDVHLSAGEKRLPSHAAEEGCPGRYWVVLAGGKYDFTAKWWNPAYYQAVVDHFAGRIQFVQCGEPGHWHPPLEERARPRREDGRRAAFHPAGVPRRRRTLPSDVRDAPVGGGGAAAGPGGRAGCVVIAGGREPTHWEAYPGHQFLHTQGALDCCAVTVYRQAIEPRG